MALIDPAAFRVNFPAFASDVTYPNTMIQFWLDVAYKQVRSQQWGSETDLGVQLFVAHNCVLEAMAVKDSQTGSVVGGRVGPANNKGVDKVSVGYDTGAGTVPGWGNWNLTAYGTRFKYYVDMFGAGMIQSGAGSGVGFPYC